MAVKKNASSSFKRGVASAKKTTKAESGARIKEAARRRATSSSRAGALHVKTPKKGYYGSVPARLKGMKDKPGVQSRTAGSPAMQHRTPHDEHGEKLYARDFAKREVSSGVDRTTPRSKTQPISRASQAQFGYRGASKAQPVTAAQKARSAEIQRKQDAASRAMRASKAFIRSRKR